MDVRARMPEAEISARSGSIWNKLTGHEKFISAGFVMCYMDFRNEVRTREYIGKCLAGGKRVALPVVKKDGGLRDILAYEVRDLETDLCKGAYGIMEPVHGRAREVEAEELDLVIVPGVAFDLKRHRLGYGAGYYDRFLRRTKPSCAKIGIAFDCQIEDKIPAEAHDIAMDAVITESRII